MDTAYVRKNPPPKQPYKGSVPPFWVPETFGDLKLPLNISRSHSAIQGL